MIILPTKCGKCIVKIKLAVIAGFILEDIGCKLRDNVKIQVAPFLFVSYVE